MSEEILKPAFLTKSLAETAVKMAINLLIEKENASFTLKRKAFHVVILVPQMVIKKLDRESSQWPNYEVRPLCLYEESLNRAIWSNNYQEIAQCKALQLWQSRNDGGTDIQPHLIFSGDTPFWGGVKRQEIVVSCSGVQPWFDRMISGIISELLIAGAYEAWMRSTDKASGSAFVALGSL